MDYRVLVFIFFLIGYVAAYLIYRFYSYKLKQKEKEISAAQNNIREQKKQMTNLRVQIGQNIEQLNKMKKLIEKYSKIKIEAMSDEDFFNFLDSELN